MIHTGQVTGMTRVPVSIGAIHFIGIGGIGMSGIAEVMRNLGYQVQGSDTSDSANVKRLRSLGIPVAIGQAAEAGLVAALAARAGFTSDLALLDGGYLPGIYGVTPDIAVLTDRLGTRFAIAEVAFKPWCAARQTMASAQAMLELVASGITADSIIAVKAFVPPPHRRMAGTPGRAGSCRRVRRRAGTHRSGQRRACAAGLRASRASPSHRGRRVARS